jgi:anti-anti-sigma factor
VPGRALGAYLKTRLKGAEVQAVSVSAGNPVIAFSGEIDMATAEAMGSALEPWVQAGGPVTIDLSAVTFIDSSCVHVLIRAAQALGERGCIIVHGAHGAVKKVIDLTGIEAGTNIHIIGCTVLTAA